MIRADERPITDYEGMKMTEQEWMRGANLRIMKLGGQNLLTFNFSGSRLMELAICQSLTHLSRHCDGKTKVILQNTSEYERNSNVRPTAIVCVREK